MDNEKNTIARQIVWYFDWINGLSSPLLLLFFNSVYVVSTKLIMWTSAEHFYYQKTGIIVKIYFYRKMRTQIRMPGKLKIKRKIHFFFVLNVHKNLYIFCFTRNLKRGKLTPFKKVFTTHSGGTNTKYDYKYTS